MHTSRGPSGRWLLAALVLSVAFGSAPIAALGKEELEYAPLSVRIFAANGDRTFDVMSMNDQVGVNDLIEQVGDSVRLGYGNPVGLPAPGLVDYYETALIQGPNAQNRLPWFGLPTARFFLYPARGSVPAYLRIHMARISEPAHDAWLPARPAVVALVDSHAHGLLPFHAAARPVQHVPVWLWPGLAALLALFALLLAGALGWRFAVTQQIVARLTASRADG